jgi:hypothetical protein
MKYRKLDFVEILFIENYSILIYIMDRLMLPPAPGKQKMQLRLLIKGIVSQDWRGLLLDFAG